MIAPPPYAEAVCAHLGSGAVRSSDGVVALGGVSRDERARSSGMRRRGGEVAGSAVVSGRAEASSARIDGGSGRLWWEGGYGGGWGLL